MPVVNPEQVGDDIYEQYSLTQTHYIDSNVEITKGEIYTKNADGHLVALGNAVSPSLIRGMFQAKDSVPAKVYDATGIAPKVQCLVKRAWIVMKAATADMVEGDIVKITGAADSITPDTVSKATAVDTSTLGRIYRILTVDATTENPKLKTAVGDILVIDTGAI